MGFLVDETRRDTRLAAPVALIASLPFRSSLHINSTNCEKRRSVGYIANVQLGIGICDGRAISHDQS